jgi:hypothetical protein
LGRTDLDLVSTTAGWVEGPGEEVDLADCMAWWIISTIKEEVRMSKEVRLYNMDPPT